jgi:hypothetical protein
MLSPEGAVMGESAVAGALALRLEVEGTRGSALTSRLVGDTLRGIPGVLDVTVDPGTGGIAIHYKPQPVVTPAIGGGPPRVSGLPAVIRPGRAQGSTFARILKTVIVVTLEVALQRFLGPLFWPRRC